jgi:TrfA protein
MTDQPLRSITEIQNRCTELAQISAPNKTAQIIQLPLWPEAKRGTPNSFLRSALFPAIQSKDRAYLKEITVASQQGISVKFTGLQLNQEDLTVWQTLVHLARQHPLGDECSFTGYSFLKMMGLKDDGSQRKSLHSSFIRLTACAVEIKGLRYPYAGGLIHEIVGDETTKRYYLRLNKNLADLFIENEWTQIHWEQRLKLRQKSLAQFLHGYYSSHRVPHPVKLETLQKLSGSRNEQAASFKRQVRTALGELVKVGFLESSTIDGDIVRVKRVHIAPGLERR